MIAIWREEEIEIGTFIANLDSEVTMIVPLSKITEIVDGSALEHTTVAAIIYTPSFHEGD